MFSPYRNREEAIENLRLWIDSECPDRNQHQLWESVPLFKCYTCGIDDGVEVGALELKIRGTNEIWHHEFPIAELNIGAKEALAIFCERCEETGWATGYFDFQGKIV